MSKSLTRRINIFLSLDEQNICDYFKPHDPVSLYKWLLGHQFQEYILSSVETAKRFSVRLYKMICMSETDRYFAEPLIHAIPRHFDLKKVIREDEFSKFKRKTYKMLGLSLSLVIALQALFQVISRGFNLSDLHNDLDVFSSVILWKPIDKLAFPWNPFLKDIHLLNRLINAEVIIIEKQSRVQKVS